MAKPNSRYVQTITHTDGEVVRVAAGVWVQPVRNGFRFICCDCGLSHMIHFRVRNGRAQMSVRDDFRSTAARRRAPKFAPVKKALRRGG